MNLPGNIQAVIIALGYALLHFLWQGVLAGAVCALGLHLMPRKYPQARYGIAVATLLAMLVLPIMTFCTYYDSAAALIHVQLSSLPSVHTNAVAGTPAVPQTNLAALLRAWFKPWLAWIVLVWLAGVVMLSLRTAIGWRWIRQYRYSARYDLPANWLATLDRLRDQLAIRRRVRAARSELIGSPSVIGWLKPLILIPPSALAGLTLQQIEMILAHELAHVRRCDYLVNLFQVVVETLLFYHPMVRWVSRQARREREHCCDDLTVKACGDARGYAHALAWLEGRRGQNTAWSLGVADGALVGRIERLVVAPSAPPTSSWLIAGLAAALLLGVLTLRPVGEPAHMLPALVKLPARRSIVTRAQSIHFVQPKVRQLVAVRPQAANLPHSVPAASSKREPTGSRPAHHSQPAVRHKPHPALRAQAHSSPQSDESAPAAVTGQSRSRTSKAGAQAERVRSDSVAIRKVAPRNKAAVAKTTAIREARRDDSKADSSAAAPAPHIAGGTPIHKASPIYPHWAQERGREGSATVKFTVDIQGRVRDIQIIKVEGGNVFGRAAANAVAKWRFKPFTEDGARTQHNMKQQFDFQLKSSRHCRSTVGSRLCR